MDKYESLYRQLIEEERYRRIKFTKEDILSMIDLALITGDKDWFMELTIRLKEVE